MMAERTACTLIIAYKVFGDRIFDATEWETLKKYVPALPTIQTAKKYKLIEGCAMAYQFCVTKEEFKKIVNAP